MKKIKKIALTAEMIKKALAKIEAIEKKRKFSGWVFLSGPCVACGFRYDGKASHEN